MRGFGEGACWTLEWVGEMMWYNFDFLSVFDQTSTLKSC